MPTSWQMSSTRAARMPAWANRRRPNFISAARIASRSSVSNALGMFAPVSDVGPA